MNSIVFPRACAIDVRQIVKHIEESSTISATRQHHIAIRQFLHLGFVTLWRRRSVDGAERMPCASEVVGINHAVSPWTSTERSIKSVVFAHFDATALTNASTAEEKRLHRPELALVEKSINRLCYFCGMRPSASTIGAMYHRHAVRVLTCRSGMTINGVTCDANHHYFVAFAVGHDGGITISALATALHTIALCQHILGRPRAAVVVRQTIAQVYSSETDVGAAGTIVTHSNEPAFRCHRDGRNAIRHHICQSGEERLFDRGVSASHFWRIT